MQLLSVRTIPSRQITINQKSQRQIPTARAFEFGWFSICIFLKPTQLECSVSLDVSLGFLMFLDFYRRNDGILQIPNGCMPPTYSLLGRVVGIFSPE